MGRDATNGPRVMGETRPDAQPNGSVASMTQIRPQTSGRGQARRSSAQGVSVPFGGPFSRGGEEVDDRRMYQAVVHDDLLSAGLCRAVPTGAG